jgi:hypothetical protein
MLRLSPSDLMEVGAKSLMVVPVKKESIAGSIPDASKERGEQSYHQF